MNLVQSLESLGLTDKQARVYIALLQTGQASAYQAAKHAGLKRPTAYVILDELVDKGVVREVPRAKSRQFIAISPEELIALSKSRLQAVENEALPELRALSRGQRRYKVRAAYYEGLDGIREMYETFFKRTKGRKYVAFYAHSRDASPELEEFFQKTRERMRKDGRHRQGITVLDDSVKRFLDPEYMKRQNITLKALPREKYDSNISIEVAGSLTQIFSHQHLQGIILDNPDIARVMKQIFKLVWEEADFGQADGNEKNRPETPYNTRKA